MRCILIDYFLADNQIMSDTEADLPPGVVPIPAPPQRLVFGPRVTPPRSETPQCVLFHTHGNPHTP